jgi:DNA-binding Lrp family transcriptional regulator
LATAFVLLIVENRGISEVLQEIKDLPEVKEAYTTHGMYEIFTRIETDTMPSLQELVSETIEKIEGIASALTLIILEPEEEKPTKAPIPPEPDL